jgi:hypothetical protein
MAFDAANYPQAKPVAPVITDELCPIWTAENPDRALAFLFVAPQDCAAVDVLASL